MLLRLLFITLIAAMTAFAQSPAIEPGVSHDLAKWRAAHYSDVRYKLNLTLEKMSPVLKGTIEIRVKVSGGIDASSSPASSSEKAPCPNINLTAPQTPIILDWRRIRGHEEKSSVTNIELNGRPANLSPSFTNICRYEESNEHLIFRDGVVAGENVIKLDFTSPILTSGSAITRYVDKEDGAEYIYSLFVPSDASTAFPVFDQPDLKARFTLSVSTSGLTVVSNERPRITLLADGLSSDVAGRYEGILYEFPETKPISTYVFSFAAGPFAEFRPDGLMPVTLSYGTNAIASPPSSPIAQLPPNATSTPPAYAGGSDRTPISIYVRKSQAAKFKPHAAEVFRLNRECIKFLETYFDYKFPFPKYDIVLIPEFPFGGMEHAGATFLREASVIFPQEPTKNDYISRANVIFHEAAHQWFGDTVTMKWFDDLWLKEGFAEFMAYKTLEAVMPEYNAWKVFYERNKQAAYLTDSTKGTTPIYQEIANLNSAKSAYGNIVYRKAPSFLKQAEFYLGPDKFQTAVRAFLKKHEYANAGWEDLVKEFEDAGWRGDFRAYDSRPISKEAEDYLREDFRKSLKRWVTQRSMPRIQGTSSILRVWEPHVKGKVINPGLFEGYRSQRSILEDDRSKWTQKFKVLGVFPGNVRKVVEVSLFDDEGSYDGRSPLFVFTDGDNNEVVSPNFVFLNYQDYGYGIFLLNNKSRDYVLKNIQNQKDDFLRTMMWGSLWDSVREGELDPRDYVELVIKNLGTTTPSAVAASTPPSKGGEQDETTVQTLLGRVSTAMRYYMPDKTGDLQSRLESVLIDRIQNAPTAGQRITFYRAFLNIASTENARSALKQIYNSDLGIGGGNTKMRSGTATIGGKLVRAANPVIDLRIKDRYDIVTKLLSLGDPAAPALLDELIRIDTTDDAKRYAYAARAAIPTKENREKYWNDFVNNKEISESWIEAAVTPFNSTRHSELSLPYLERALKELPTLKRSRKIFFVNGWLAAFIGGQRSEEALAIINKFLADNPTLDKDLRLKILENSDLIERAVKIREKFKSS